MTHSDTTQTTFQTTLIRTGAVLTGSGLMVAAVGMTMTAVAVMRGAAAWARQREVSPAAVAADKLERVRHATLAGAQAWREYADTADGSGHSHSHGHGHHARLP